VRTAWRLVRAGFGLLQTPSTRKWRTPSHRSGPRNTRFLRTRAGGSPPRVRGGHPAWGASPLSRKDPAVDGSRFDTLTRSLAAPKTRRGLLGSLAALGAGLLGARATEQADAQVSQLSCGNQFCASNPGGCKSGCVCCVYTNPVTNRVINSRCRPPGTCAPGTAVCPPGQIPDASGGCAAPTTTTTTTAAPGQTCPVGAGTCGGGSGVVYCRDDLRCSCETTTAGDTVCRHGPSGVCFDCATDADCAAVRGPGSFCLRGPECCPVGGTFCAPPCPPAA
jgi:hypothetical protein